MGSSIHPTQEPDSSAPQGLACCISAGSGWKKEDNPLFPCFSDLVVSYTSTKALLSPGALSHPAVPVLP